MTILSASRHWALYAQEQYDTKIGKGQEQSASSSAPGAGSSGSAPNAASSGGSVTKGSDPATGGGAPQDFMQKLYQSYRTEGMRKSFYCVLLCHNQEGHPCIILKKKKDGSLKLIGGKVRAGETGVKEALQRKLRDTIFGAPKPFEVGELLSIWYWCICFCMCIFLSPSGQPRRGATDHKLMMYWLVATSLLLSPPARPSWFADVVAVHLEIEFKFYYCVA